ncbi:hemerythrin domain-containing protein [Neobacillus sp. LXY-4]|uniref:hemerythrin domain-containing protein n=1 Tax=Neobacillus sp. LXY-4 TaxID=3379826 RepID=UPI003EE35323
MEGAKTMEGCFSSMMGNEPVSLSEGLAQLKGEHIPLLEKLHGLFDLCSKIETNDHPESHFGQLKSAVKVFMTELEPHSEREEQVLFRMMEKYIGVGMGPIAVMEYEHDQAKSLIGRFFEKTSGSDDLSVEMMREYSDLIKNAYLTLVDHFAKEENVLFPMAERMLTTEEKAELYKQINEI